MNNFIILSKVSIKSLFSQLKLSSRSKRFGPKVGVYVLLGLFLLVSLSMFVSYYEMAKMLRGTGQEGGIIISAFFASSIVVFIFTISSCQSLFFSNKETELLFSLPLKRTQIVLSKIFALMVFNLVICAVFMLPAFVAYFSVSSITVVGVLGAVLAFMTASLIGFSLAMLFSCITTLFVSKLKLGSVMKSLILGIMTIALLIGIMIIQYSNPANLATSLAVFVPFSNSVVKAIGGAMGINMLWYVLVNIGALVIGSAVVVLFYKKLVLRSNSTASRKKKTVQEYAPKSQLSILLKKEIKRYFSSYIYVINTIIGAVLLVVLAIASIFYSDVLTSISQSFGTGIGDFAIVLFVSIFFIAMSTTTSSSISLEGKNIYLLKSLPISVKEYYCSKILTNFIVISPLFIVSTTVFSIVLKLNIVNILIFFALEILVLFANSIFGLYVNLKFPKFNYTNETFVVKQSLPAMLTVMVLPFISIILFSIFISVFITKISIYYFILFYSILIIIFAIVFLLILIKNGKKYYNNLQ